MAVKARLIAAAAMTAASFCAVPPASALVLSGAHTRVMNRLSQVNAAHNRVINQVQRNIAAQRKPM